MVPGFGVVVAVGEQAVFGPMVEGMVLEGGEVVVAQAVFVAGEVTVAEGVAATDVVAVPAMGASQTIEVALPLVVVVVVVVAAAAAAAGGEVDEDIAAARWAVGQ